MIPFACDILMFDPKTDGKLVSKNLTIIYQGTCSSIPTYIYRESRGFYIRKSFL